AAAVLAAGALLTLPALVTSPFAFLWLSKEAMAIERPVAPGEEIASEVEREMRLVLEAPWSPFGQVRGQWALFAAGLRGREEYPVKEQFGVDATAVLRPPLLEWGDLRSPWWASFRARTGIGAIVVAPIVLVTIAVAAAIALARTLRRSS
ncbi:MAG TPA: hypothetical protein VKE69_14860, partial [Planctomycetota bacterium]|nr:hypothetical protein [Planctomycetota bacterium]